MIVLPLGPRSAFFSKTFQPSPEAAIRIRRAFPRAARRSSASSIEEVSLANFAWLPHLMSSRLGPAISSTFCGVRLEGLLVCGIRRRHARHLSAQPHCARVCRASVRAPTAAQASCRRGRSAGAVGFLSRAMDNERKSECYSTSPSGASGADQTTPSTVLPHVQARPKVKGLAIRFCSKCGGATEEKIPTGEHEMRYVCTKCDAIHYQNPKMVVGCLVEHEGKVLLCRRSIQPSYGLWTLPAGYMEIGESAAEGAARETREEACADIQVLGLFSHLDIPFIGQSYIIFRAQLKDPHFAPGPESLECTLFKLNEIPFDSLAFSSIHVALSMYVEDRKVGKSRVHHAVIDKRPGSSPSDLNAFLVRDVLTS